MKIGKNKKKKTNFFKGNAVAAYNFSFSNRIYTFTKGRRYKFEEYHLEDEVRIYVQSDGGLWKWLTVPEFNMLFNIEL